MLLLRRLLRRLKILLRRQLRLPQLLRAVPKETICRMQRALAAHYRALLWQTPWGVGHPSAYDLTQVLLCRRAKAKVSTTRSQRSGGRAARFRRAAGRRALARRRGRESRRRRAERARDGARAGIGARRAPRRGGGGGSVARDGVCAPRAGVCRERR